MEKGMVRSFILKSCTAKKRWLITTGLFLLIMLVGIGSLAAVLVDPTMTRTVTPLYGPPNQIFTVRLTATGGSGNMTGIIKETKPSSFVFYDNDSWGGTFDVAVPSINGDHLNIAFMEEGASGYYTYILKGASSSGTLSGNVEWAGDGVENLGEANLTICTDSDEDGYNVTDGTAGLCGPVDCDDNYEDDPSPCPHDEASATTLDCNNLIYSVCAHCINPGADEVCDDLDNDCDKLIDEDLSRACGSDSCTGTQTCSDGDWGDCNSEGRDCGTCALCDATGSCTVYDGTQDDDCPLCQECFAINTCANQLQGLDVKEECPTGDCKYGYCDGNGACSMKAATTDCGICAECDGEGKCVEDLTQHKDCDFCKKCTGIFSCGNQANGEDLKDECPAAACDLDSCNGNGQCQDATADNGYLCVDDCTYCDTGSCGNRPAGATDECNICQECNTAGGDCTGITAETGKNCETDCYDCIAGSCTATTEDNDGGCNDDCNSCVNGVCQDRAQCDGTECGGQARCDILGGDCKEPDIGLTVCTICYSAVFDSLMYFESPAIEDCCDDDNGEYYITLGVGTEACCNNVNDCVDSNGNCQDEYSTEITCNDVIDNDCDGLIDCADDDCAGKAGPNDDWCCQSESNCVGDDDYDELCNTPTCSSNVCTYPAIADNTQDTVGSQLCDGLCKACQSGSCGNSNAETDPGDDCPVDDCANGFCNGNGACDLEPPTIVCRTSAGICDIAEYCTGDSVSCPRDKVSSQCTACAIGYCNGTSVDCVNPNENSQRGEDVCEICALKQHNFGESWPFEALTTSNCCDNDVNEYYITNGVGQPACCDNVTENCVDAGGICRDEYPNEVTCDNKDNDCDGKVDEDLTRPTSNQSGLCAGNTETCNAGNWLPDATNYVPVGEDSIGKCDGLDNDCDNLIDESKNTGADANCDGKVCNNELLDYMVKWQNDHWLPNCDSTPGCVSNSKLLTAMFAWKNTHWTCAGGG